MSFTKSSVRRGFLELMKLLLIASLAVGLAAQTSKVPASIQAAFTKQFPNAKIKKVAKEKRDGKVVYEVESTDAGQNRDIIYSATGDVIEIEEGIALTALPAPVSAAVKAQFPKATITSAEKLTVGTVISYEVVLTGAAKNELILTPEGKPVK